MLHFRLRDNRVVEAGLAAASQTDVSLGTVICSSKD